MQETNIIARVIQTLPQSFIEANIEKLCYAIAGVNPLNNKNVSLTFLDNGGFEFTNLEAQTSNRFVGSAFKDKDDVLKKLTDFLRKRNEIISQAFKTVNNDFSFPFFPIQYMKPIAVFPNYTKGQFGRMIKSWTVTYKIEITAYDNPTTRRYEYANVVNSGIEITASSGGQVIGLKYNLLPLETRKGSALFKVVSDENEIPQLAYLLNKETNTVAPFYLATTEEAYIPATRESILPGASNSNLNLLNNPTDFDKNRIVVWLKRIGISKKLKAKDSSATSESNNSNVLIPVGVKVIRLKPNSENDENTPCVFWWQGSYHESSLPERNLGNNNVVLSTLSGKVFLNDIEHLLYRIKPSLGKNKQFDEVINFVTNKKNIQLSKQIMIDALTLYQNALLVNTNNKPETIKRFSKLVEEVYNPIGNENNKWFDELLILPLSEDWFNSDEKLKHRYKTVWQTNGFLNNLGGGSGAYSFTQDELSAIKDEILYLKSFITETTQTSSPEAMWLNTIDQQFLNSIRRIIFISNATWYYNKFQRYAEYIGINVSFSIFSAPPLLSVILHEFSQGDSYYYNDVIADPHITPEQTEQAWEEISSLPNNFELLRDQEFTDQLYQCDVANSFISLAILLKILDKI
jgi:hypothetical protein